MRAIIENKNISALLVVYIMLKPLYFWESGTVQIADLVLTVGLLFYVFIKHGRIVINRSSAIALQYLFLVILYQTIVNCLWYFFIRESSLLKASLYYIFNFSAFFITLAIAEEGSLEQIKKSIAIGSFLSVIITLFGLIVVQGGSRKTGFFNNPNQLGYYAVIMLTVLLYLKEYMNKWQRIVVFIGSIWAIIVSLSKAAIFGSFGLLIIYLAFYQKNRNLKRIIKQFILLLVILSVGYYLFFSNSSLVLNNTTLLSVRYRILNMMNENDSDLGSGRGYGRVLEMGAHYLWGVGEGAYYRFSVKTGSEIHSTIVSLFVSYGVIGLFGYMIFLYKCLAHRGLIIRNLAIMTGMLLYSITHNGIRNTLLWIILATLLIDNQKPNFKISWQKESQNEFDIKTLS